MEIKMTWTALYIDDDRGLLYKTVNAPHGESEAWSYIEKALKLNIIAIIPGCHSVYSNQIENDAE
jgi:hypothetical protein